MTLNTTNAKELDGRIRRHGVPKYLLVLTAPHLQVLLEQYSIWASLEVVKDWKKNYQ